MPPAIPANDATKASFRDALSMSLLLPEPEVLKAELSEINCRTLAKLTAALISEHEPLLNANADGTTVTVSERGGTMKMRFKVEAF